MALIYSGKTCNARPEKTHPAGELSSNWFSNSSQWHEQPGFLNLAEFEVVVIQVLFKPVRNI